LRDDVLETNETFEEKAQSAPIRIPTQAVPFEDITPAAKLIPEKPIAEPRKEEEKVLPKKQIETVKKDSGKSIFDVPDGNCPL
jgi:hypothetical protein